MDVPEQTVALTELSLGIDGEIPLDDRHTLTWGASGIWSEVDIDGGTPAFVDAFEGERARVHLGYRYANGAGVTANAEVFVDGLGSDSYTTYGVNLGLDKQF